MHKKLLEVDTSIFFPKKFKSKKYYPVKQHTSLKQKQMVAMYKFKDYFLFMQNIDHQTSRNISHKNYPFLI